MTAFTPREDSIGRIVLQAIADAPPRARRSMIFAGVAVAIGLSTFLIDLTLEDRSPSPFRTAGVLLALAGMVVLSLAGILHGASQHKVNACRATTLFTLRSVVMDRVFVALPALGMTAALCFVASIVCQLASWRGENWVQELVRGLLIALVAVYLVAAVRYVVQAVRFVYRYAGEQALAAAHAREEATTARLAALQAQMNPHFLFNALNTIASLVRTDGRSAESTILNLSQVLRRTLERSGSSMQSVRDEIEYVRAYLGVEQERWKDRLHLGWEIEPEVLDLALPPMTLQPLIENALRHGIGERIDGGWLVVRAARDNGHVVLSVTDDGVGLSPRWREGTGLTNVRRRLETLYGADAELRLESRNPGARATVVIPAERAP